ncbi:SigB/SigF/SigG family RNA polymerase sigma factor [Plantactinospora sp. GCM10030261]|uniref:SigB/SigF/SigG family RNA polymerase sigma factor n=1 Tax=Plantactinospora sp. GCM10030261 TaxID=3273420 RepID=UPI00360C87A4
MIRTAASTTSNRIDPAALDAMASAYAERAGSPDTRGAGHRDGRNDLVRAALPFATRIARRYANRGEPLDDLEQVARLGLVKAVDRFDPDRGPFTGYAAVTITGELRRHFRDRTWSVHVPRRMQELSREVVRLDADLTTELHRRPTVVELATRLNRSTDDIHTARETAAAYASLSLNAPRHDDPGTELADDLGAVDPHMDMVEDRVTVTALLCRLPARERQILALRFYGNRTQQEIADELGISQMHVSRLLTRALAWLRQCMLSDRPQSWHPGSAALDSLVLRHQRVGDVLRIEVVGEIDRDTAGRLRDALLHASRQPVRQVELRLRGVPFIDAAGISALLVGFEAARGAHIRLRLTAVQPHVVRTLRMARLSFLLNAQE